ncbi:thermonuclease family protein [Dechloromonas sp. A34]|uniref:thermonuclease family protein n=1 Tax=Dechloromonas sp. A34 TaxID=447588 RepID=UPI0022497E85|nr:thermonuclease family protein [Dechloromonas sp. A34]
MKICRLLAFAALVLLSNCVLADILIGRVVRIADGDTLTVLEDNRVQYKVRLAGIDTPERRQAFGAKAKRHLSDMVMGRTVTVEYGKLDRYKRIVGKVTLNGVDICLEQIKAGLA